MLLLFLTQRLASERDFHRKVTLSAIHDKSAAWFGIGSATKSLWNQWTVSTAPVGVICILLYLGSLFALNITTPGLLSFSLVTVGDPSLTLTTYYLTQLQRRKCVSRSPSSSISLIFWWTQC